MIHLLPFNINFKLGRKCIELNTYNKEPADFLTK